MKRRFLKFGIPLLILGIFFAVPNFANAQLGALANPYSPSSQYMANTSMVGEAAKATAVVVKTAVNTAFGPIFTAIGYVITVLSSIALIFAGFIYDTVINFTIVDMSQNLGSASELGKSISAAWATLRDIANMAFIFVLLYAAFRAMFDSNFGNFQSTVKNIIIVALLINFSLFFTKVAIDASNIVSLGFYRAIQSNNTTMTGGVGAAAGSASFGGISGGYMKMLGLQSWYDSNLLNHVFNAEKVITIAFISAVFMLVAAVIFLITGVMFAARFIILIFLMILSPLAVVAYAIPGQKQHFNKWVESLKGQLIFPPLFFALTWVAFRLGNTLMSSTLSTSFSTNAMWANTVTDPFKNTAETAALLLNFVLVIGFSIAALIFSKQVANKTMGFGAVSTGIGTAAIGTAAFAGRQTIGRGANWISENKREQWSQSRLGRMGLWTADKTKSASFDLSSSSTLKKVPGLGGELGILGKPGGKGGFAKGVEEKAKRKADYAKRVYGETPTDKARDDAEQKRLEAEAAAAKTAGEEEVRNKRKAAAEEARKEYKTKADDLKAYERTQMGENFDNLERLKQQKASKERELQEARTRGENELELKSIKDESDSISKSIEYENGVINERRKELGENDDDYIAKKEAAEEAKSARDAAKKAIKAKIKDEEYGETVQEKIKAHKEFKKSGQRRQEEYAKRLGSGWFGWTAGNQAASREVEKRAKGKTAKDELAEAAKKLAKEEEEANKASEEPVTPPPTPPPAPPATS